MAQKVRNVMKIAIPHDVLSLNAQKGIGLGVPLHAGELPWCKYWMVNATRACIIECPLY